MGTIGRHTEGRQFTNAEMPTPAVAPSSREAPRLTKGCTI